MARRLVLAAVLAGGCLAVVCGSAVAAPADLDRTFGEKGIARVSPALDVPRYSEETVDMAIGPRDEVFVLSQACPQPEECSLAVTRYSHDGFRDFSYGTGGRAVVFIQLPTNPMPRGPYGSIVADAEGRVVVVTTNAGDLTLLRLDSRGVPDATFGLGGTARTDLGAVESPADAVLQTDGSIVVAGRQQRGGDTADLILARYLSTGALDPAFGQQGSTLANLLPNDVPVALALTAEGQIVVGVDECCTGRGGGVVARFRSDGSLDGGFSSQVSAHATSLSDVVPLASGKLDVLGEGGSGGFIARLLVNGRPDRSFGRQGIVSLGSHAGSPEEGVIDAAGRLVLGGSVDTESRTPIWVMRRLRNGQPDRTFAGGWQQRVDLGDIGRLDGLAIQSGGRIVALGEGAECFRMCARRAALLRFRGGDSGVRCAGRKATVVGTRRGETLRGTAHRDVIAALGGNDNVLGRGGNDLICGGPGRDRLDGGPGRNRLRQ